MYRNGTKYKRIQLVLLDLDRLDLALRRCIGVSYLFVEHEIRLLVDAALKFTFFHLGRKHTFTFLRLAVRRILKLLKQLLSRRHLNIAGFYPF